MLAMSKSALPRVARDNINQRLWVMNSNDAAPGSSYPSQVTATPTGPLARLKRGDPPALAVGATAVLATAMGLVVARRLVRNPARAAGLGLNRPATEPLVALVGGLLSSSCCAIQLILNLFSVSCAGFAVMDVYRIPFTCLTFGLLGWKRMIAKQSGAPFITRESLAVMGAALVLTLMPNMVRASNERVKVNDVGQTEWYSVQGMKCLGCANGFKKDLLAKGEGGLLSQSSTGRYPTTSIAGSRGDSVTW